MKLAEVGTITTKSTDEPHGRAVTLHRAVCEAIDAVPGAAVAVETWYESSLPPSARSHHRRNHITQPAYGYAIGIVMGAALASRRIVVASPADEWSADMGCKATGGKDKPKRVEFACFLFGIEPERFGAAVTKRGDRADAAILGAWALARVQADRVIAFDPSLTQTGYAVVER